MFSNPFLGVMISSLTACGVTTLGIFLIAQYAKWSREQAHFLISFAAGVLLTVSFLHIIPRSFEMNAGAPVFLLIGFLALYLLNRFVNLYLCREFENMEYVAGLIPVLGIALHSLIDGMIYSVTFNVSVFTGVLAAIGMIFHEFPEGVITFVLLERGGFDRRQSLTYAFLAAALTTPLGAVISFPFIKDIDRGSLGALLALSAGALVYVGATHLLPEVEEQEKGYSVLTLAAGVLVGLVIILSKSS